MYLYLGKISWSDKFQNEVVTIIFPSTMSPGAQVYLFSQWSAIPRGLDSKAFSAFGVIKPSDTQSEVVITLALSHPSGSIDLSATRLDNNDLLLRLGNSLIAEDLATLSLVYEAFGVQPFVCTGKFNFEVPIEGATHKAVDETLLAISAHDESGAEKLLCVLWQWTETDTADALNTNFISSPLSTSRQPGLTDGRFTFSFKKGPNGQRLQKLLLETEDTLLKTEVVLNSLANRYTITNNTDGFVNCAVKADNSIANDIFTWGGLGLAALGVPFVYASATAGLPFAIGSFVFGGSSVVWNIGTVQEGRYTGISPGDGFTIVVPAAITIFVMRIKQRNQSILVQSTVLNYTQPSNVNISSVPEKDWADMIRIEQAIPTGKQFLTRGVLHLDKMRPAMVGVTVGDNNNNINMGIYSHDDTSGALFHKGLTDEYADLSVLEYNSNSSASILFSNKLWKNCEIIRPSIYEPYIVLVLRHVDVLSQAGDLTSVSGAITPDNRAAMLHAISLDNQRYRAYYYHPINGVGRVMGVRHSATNWTVKVLRDGAQYKDTFTFLRVEQPVVLNATNK